VKRWGEIQFCVTGFNALSLWKERCEELNKAIRVAPGQWGGCAGLSAQGQPLLLMCVPEPSPAARSRGSPVSRGLLAGTASRPAKEAEKWDFPGRRGVGGSSSSKVLMGKGGIPDLGASLSQKHA